MGEAYKNTSVTFSPTAIRNVRAWYATGSPAPWLEYESEDVRFTIASDHGSDSIDALRDVLLAGLIALDKLAEQQPDAARHVIVNAPWPPEQPEAGEQS